MGGKIKDLGKKVTKPLGFVFNPAIALGAKTLGFGKSGGGGGGGGISYPGGQDPVQLLSQTGGAPLLGQIVLGADIDTALAGYLGISVDEVKSALSGNNKKLSASDITAIQNTKNQLSSIQNDRNLRQQAVDKVIQDYPNIMAAESQRAGAEYDSSMKQYVDQALGKTAAQFAAGGSLSSGAMNEAAAKVGAEFGRDRLEYTTGMGRDLFNTRLAEVNALRDFQNTLLTGQIQQGFSAQQANLQRQFQGQSANADAANQRSLADQQSKNALFGALGSVGGTVIGAYFGGPMGAAVGSQLGGNLFGSTTPRLNTSALNGLKTKNSYQGL